MRGSICQQHVRERPNLRSAEELPVLPLGSFGFQAQGAGSWSEALDRLETLKGVGMGFTGEGQKHHLERVSDCFKALLNDLFDVFEHFTRRSEVSQIDRLLGTRVYEAGGSFDRLFGHITTTTAALNSIVQMHPTFGAFMGGSPSGGSTGQQRQGGKAKSNDSGGSPVKAKNVVFANGVVSFGKGAQIVQYNAQECMQLIRTVVPNASRANFCLVRFLSSSGKCLDGGAKHPPGCAQHKFSKPLLELRPQMESKPYRVDDKAKEPG